MRKITLPLVTMLIATLMLAAGLTAYAAEQITFETASVSVYENAQTQLQVHLSDGLAGGEVQFTSGSPRVATVDQRGVVTGVSKGNAVITATLKTAKQTYKATAKVTVLRAVTEISLIEEDLNVLTEADGLPFYLAQNRLSDALPEDQYEQGMSLERIILLNEGRKLTVRATLKPNTASDRTFAVASSDENVLSVRKLVLTGAAPGASLLTVSSVSNPEVSVRYGVLVITPVTRLTVDTVQTVIGVGGTAQLTASFTPEDATLKAVRWTSETPKVATVDENGLVTALAKGKATITATALDGSRRKDSVSITVQLLPTGISLGSEAAIQLGAGRTRTLKAEVTPSNATNTKVTWTSTDPGVARVNQEGRVTAVARGECEIVAACSADSTIEARVRVEVIQEVTALKFTQRSMSLNVGESALAEVEVSPADANNRAVSFSVDNTRVATVDESGMIRAVGRGSTTVRAKATDGSNKSASIALTVTQLPESITLDKSSVTVNTGRSATVRATVQPTNANNRYVNWESTDTSVARVNSDGQITGVKAGTCQVICRARGDNAVTATVDVTVHQLVTSITPESRTLSVNVNETGRIRWTVNPGDVTDPSVTLSSNKTSVATVDADGTVHALKRGECTVTIKAQDGSNKQATVKVSVLQPVEGVTMEESFVQADVDGTVRLKANLIPSDASNTAMVWHSMDESVATVSGRNTRPTVTGHRWGTAEIVGYTVDGGFETSAWVTVQNYDTAVRATDLYLSDNAVKLTLMNVSNIPISRVEFTVECYDIYDIPLACNINGANIFDGLYQYPLGERESTRHGRFNFIDYVQPSEEIGRVVLTVTCYYAQEGWRYVIPESKQRTVEYKSPSYIGYIPAPDVTEETDDIVVDGEIPPVG